MNESRITHFFHRPKEVVFAYFTRRELFELWAAPEGMTLKIYNMEGKKEGKYSMTHTGPNGDYVCNGHYKEFIPNKRIVSVDNILGPDGNMFFHNLESVTEFESQREGTKVTITQRGLPDENSRRDCQQSWEQCFEKLESLLSESKYSEAQF